MRDRVGWGEGRAPPKFLTSIKNCKMAEKKYKFGLPKSKYILVKLYIRLI